MNWNYKENDKTNNLKIFLEAAEQGNLEAIKYGLDALSGELITEYNENGDNAFSIATKANQKAVLTFLAEKYCQQLPVQLTDFLLQAVKNRNQITVKKILEINPSIIDEYAGNNDNALIIAVRNADNEMIRLLEKHGANFKKAIGKRNKVSLLHIAAFTGNNDIINDWNPTKVEINSKNNKGNTPIMDAALGGNLATIKLLAAKGANLAVKNAHGRNILTEIVYKLCELQEISFSNVEKYKAIMDYFLSNKFLSIDSTDNKNQTALMMLANTSVAEKLQLQSKKRWLKMQKSNQVLSSPMIEKEMLELMQFLLKYDPKLDDIKNSIKLAADKGKKAFVDVLKNYEKNISDKSAVFKEKVVAINDMATAEASASTTISTFSNC